jgi:hypothetical protein
MIETENKFCSPAGLPTVISNNMQLMISIYVMSTRKIYHNPLEKPPGGMRFLLTTCDGVNGSCDIEPFKDGTCVLISAPVELPNAL